MTTEFQLAIGKLYSTFSKYPVKSTIKGCPCCVSDLDKYSIHSKPLQFLLNKDLSKYAFKAITTWGDVNDFKHYLPRIFELAAKRDLTVDTFIILKKLDLGGWQEWDIIEQESIKEFIKAWWKYDINNTTFFDSGTLVELNKILRNIRIMLSDWNLNIQSQGFKNFIELIEDHYYEIVNNDLTSFDLEIKDILILKEWIDSNSKKLEEGFFYFQKEEKDLSNRISNSLYIIERLRN